ncbi:phosphonate ABC transporter ATP-binding protein [Oleidesulfovibrio alaskensis]|jgi:phosphonate transport system ATP-binding protein|uniref:phosphonate ABC transporter ATP-binding protein n=1 Tax=Oleidesulfovibrio alaskensis TaxID=58180 RepID=UPI001A3E64C1|nr:phosphonate ABC transporter ATP-binding protein [Oleidesulfovibrio alaskensis]MBL3583706.1 phosphonate ABC transporter ATP-binding protein [Oleidesulfovibrio alaskensis]
MHNTTRPAARLPVPAIRAHQLNKIYPNGTRAVSDVSLTVHTNEFVSVIGSSGAGKSSLLRCINRLIRPTSGTLELFGEDITKISGRHIRQVRGKVGMIFQQFNLVRRLSVLENVLVSRLRFNSSFIGHCCTLVRHFSRNEKEFAFECLQQVGIEHLAFQRADTLSGGQQQRVAIARALAQEPEIFLADEPIASLDPHSAEVVMDTLMQIHETRHIPVLVNLHHIDFATRYGKRIVGMRKGKIIHDVPPSGLTDDLITDIYGARINEAFGELAACA